ncbi:MAG: dUTP diphosphatase [Patescibacteria group bacterium]|nr:dUTP diphosphatase [Patescibacteria group bacterium]MDD5555004.1 dUTP diphosphatase [Patescibacteria group bacterium]
MNTNKKGKFIVIDGTDGSGKATQTQMLFTRLENSGLPVAMIDFPQYGEKSAGLIEKYLNGDYGKADEVGPYRASIFYACDRYDASFKIKKWLGEGKIVIANRYVTANMGHQGGKIANPLERKNYFSWLYELEYEIFNIPKPDLNIILHVDAAIAQKLVDQKGHRDYINGAKRDLHEADINHLRRAEQVYLEIARTFPDFTLIECTRNGEIMTRQEIHNLVWQEVNRLISFREKSHIPFLNTLEYEKNLNKPVLKIERIKPNAKLPQRTHEGDAGLDLYAADYYSLLPGESIVVSTGIKMAIPEGYAGLIWDKSGVAKSGIHTTAGVIDSNYRGEILVNMINLSEDIYNIAPGQKIAQILIQPAPNLEIKEDKINDETERNNNGFGSSGLF